MTLLRLTMLGICAICTFAAAYTGAVVFGIFYAMVLWEQGQKGEL